MKSLGMTASIATPIFLDGEVWGALVATVPDEEQLPPGCENRLTRLAELISQALVNDAARAELAESRTRLLEQSDEMRRRLERALHEGAHQHVVALALKLRVALGRSDPASAEAEVLRDALADAMEASTELSELARGLHPAVLSERGLAAALQAVAARAEVFVNLHALPGRRFPAVVETTAYLMVTEALTNIDKHASATDCSLSATDRGDTLTVEVRDNGCGGAVLDARRRAGVHQRPRGGAWARASRWSRRWAAARPCGSRSRPGDLSDWAASFTDRVRYGDLDTNAHLNNVAYHQFFESARVAYMRELFPGIEPLGREGGFGMIFAETHLRFASPGVLRGGAAGGRAAVAAAALEHPDRLRDASASPTSGWWPRAGGRSSATTTRQAARRRCPEHVVERLREDGAS